MRIPTDEFFYDDDYEAEERKSLIDRYSVEISDYDDDLDDLEERYFDYKDKKQRDQLDYLEKKLRLIDTYEIEYDNVKHYRRLYKIVRDTFYSEFFKDKLIPFRGMNGMYLCPKLHRFENTVSEFNITADKCGEEDIPLTVTILKDIKLPKKYYGYETDFDNTVVYKVTCDCLECKNEIDGIVLEKLIRFGSLILCYRFLAYESSTHTLGYALMNPSLKEYASKAGELLTKHVF